MNSQLVIAMALVFMLVLVAAYDVYAVYALPPGSTVSAVLQSWAVRWPMLGVAVGIVLGHLFWPVGDRQSRP